MATFHSRGKSAVDSDKFIAERSGPHNMGELQTHFTSLLETHQESLLALILAELAARCNSGLVMACVVVSFGDHRGAGVGKRSPQELGSG